MNKLAKGSLTLLFLGILAQPALAREFADIYTECGLGAMIAPRNEAVAAVTNVTWDLGTTAISSNVSSPDSCVGGQARMAIFIHESQDLILNELAAGSGDYLNALATLAGVSMEKKEDFLASLRIEVTEIISSSNFLKSSNHEKSEQIFNIVNRTLVANS